MHKSFCIGFVLGCFGVMLGCGNGDRSADRAPAPPSKGPEEVQEAPQAKSGGIRDVTLKVDDMKEKMNIT